MNGDINNRRLLNKEKKHVKVEHKDLLEYHPQGFFFFPVLLPAGIVAAEKTLTLETIAVPFMLAQARNKFLYPLSRACFSFQLFPPFIWNASSRPQFISLEWRIRYHSRKGWGWYLSFNTIHCQIGNQKGQASSWYTYYRICQWSPNRSYNVYW